MRVYKKNVYYADKMICLSMNNKTGNPSSCNKVEKNVIFVKVDDENFVDLDDLIYCKLPKHLARKFVKQYKLQPHKDNDLYLANVRQYFKNNSINTDEKVEITNIKTENKTL